MSKCRKQSVGKNLCILYRENEKKKNPVYNFRQSTFGEKKKGNGRAVIDEFDYISRKFIGFYFGGFLNLLLCSPWRVRISASGGVANNVHRETFVWQL